MLRQRALWCPLEWRMDTLPFVDIPFQLLVVFSFISLSLFCPRLETRAYKYSAPGSSKEKRRGPGRSRGVLFPPFFIFASSAATCSNERAGHTGHLFFLLCQTLPPSPSVLAHPHTPFPLPGPGSSYLRSVIYPSYELFAARGILRAYRLRHSD